ncbi:MAG TPA: DnaA/Hda family protein, partial [Gemmatimonadaceae bacterium]|nr:DnaA/Hda family protein [Gemmatimonadaceae bacterium]
DELLLTRFSGGLIVDIDKPDYETRVAILRRKCEELGINFVAGVTEAVARIGHGNVRELEGALNRLMAFQQLGEGQVVPATVPKILGGRYTPAPGTAAIPDEFSAFVSDLAAFVSGQVDESTQRLADAVAMWSEAGYVTDLLEGTGRGQVEDAIAAFETAVKRLQELEAAGTDADPSLAGAEVFRDPSRISEAENLVSRAVAAPKPPPGPAEVFTRDLYEIAPCNQFAVHAGEAVVREPGRRYNPLVMHGEAGVGKSHLLHAIGNGLADVPGMRVACAKAQLFVDELIAALEDGTVERWRARWRNVDALLLDDAQVIAGTEAAQIELFNLFNTLHAADKQIVLAFDCSPPQLETLDDRLRSRFAGGLVVEIRAPDSTLRQKLYRSLLQRLGHVVPTDVLSYLARRESDDVREVIGIADLLARKAQESDSPITLGFARRLLDDVPMTPVRSATPIRSRTATSGAPEPAATPAVITTPVTPAAAVRRPFVVKSGIKDVDTFFLDREKTIWEWPELGGRAIEEIR